MTRDTADRKIDNPKVPPGLHDDIESKPERDDEKGERPAIEMGNRDRGPKPEDSERRGPARQDANSR